MQLSESQKAILKAYAKECHPNGIDHYGEDFKKLTQERYIFAIQDHITDKGLAYAVAEMNYPFVRFLRDHRWERRLKIFLDFARRVFTSDEELNIYFKAKYRANLAFDTWGPDGQEQQLPNDKLKKFVCVMFIDLLDIPMIDWQKLQRLFRIAANQINDKDALDNINKVNSKDDFEKTLKDVLRELQEQKSYS